MLDIVRVLIDMLNGHKLLSQSRLFAIPMRAVLAS
jgi:hypothetical protein